MPPDFEFQYPAADLWTTVRITPTSAWMPVAARLRAGVSPAQANGALAIIARQMESESPQERAGFKITVTRWSDTPAEKYELTLIFVLAAVGLVLLIACADVGGLLLGRAVERRREIAIRASLGAGFWRVARQLLAESLALAALGSLAGLLLARGLLGLLTKQLAALPIVLSRLQGVALNARVLAFNAALCVLLAAFCGLAPVLLAARIDLEAVLRGGRSSSPRGSSRLFAALIAAEAAFAFLLLVGSGLMIRSLIRLQQEDHGFRPDHVLTLRVPVGSLSQPRPTGKYDTRPRQMAYYREILERVRTVPGITAAAIVNNLPLSGINSATNLRGPDGQPVTTSTRTISPQYFAAMGIPLIAGRTFTDEDRADSPRVAIINERLAREFFAGRNPIGEHLPEASAAPSGPTVVGVVKDTSQMSYELPAKSEIYIPYQQYIFATFMSTVVVRTSGDPMALAAALRKKVWAVDPDQPVVLVQTMNEVVANSIWRPRFSAWIFSILGGLAVLLTAIGIYAVVAYTSGLRAREVGIRVALGATPPEVAAVILRGAMMPLILGLAVSVVVTLLLSRLLAGILYGISGSDPVTYAGAAGLLLAIGALASARPAWRAATRDPLLTLRAE
jgi:putative ABC transport system permease protein